MDNRNIIQSGQEEERQENEEKLQEEEEQPEDQRDVSTEEILQPEDGEGEDEVNHSEIKGFLDWLKEEFDKDPQSDIPTDLLIKQFLLWSDQDTSQKQKVKEDLSEYFGLGTERGKDLLGRLRNIIGLVYRPSPDSSFPWQTVMTKLLDERVQELQNVNYDAGIRYKRLKEAYKNQDEFTSQVILLSLAMTSDFKQEWLEEYYQNFAKHKQIENPDSGKMQWEYVPNTKQLWFQNKLRRTAKQAKVFHVWKGYRFELNDEKEVVLMGKEEIAKNADYDSELIGGRRADLASEPFSYNTYDDQNEVDATNQLLKKKMKLLSEEIEKYQQELQKIKHFPVLPEKAREFEQKKDRFQQRINEHKRQMEIIGEMLGIGGYQIGDMKTILLDPLASRDSYVEIEEKRYYERFLAMDLGFTKFMTGKLATDVNITLRGEHAIPQDIAAFIQMLSLRRIQEFEWACKHSFFGARVSVTGEYDDKRNTYKNSISRMLNADDREAHSFTRMALGFYFDNGKILAVHKRSGETVILGDYTPQARKNIEKEGYFDSDIAFKGREVDLEKRIEEAYAAGQIFKGEKSKRESEEVLGDLAVRVKENENIDDSIADILDDAKGVDPVTKKPKIDISQLEGELAREYRRIHLDIGLYLDKFASELFGIEDDPYRSDINNLIKRKFIEFSNQFKTGQIPSFPQIRLEELNQFRKILDESEQDIKGLLKEANEELKKSCRALVIEKGLQEDLLPIFKTIREKRPVNLEDIEQVIKSAQAHRVELGLLSKQVQTEKKGLQDDLKKLTEFRDADLAANFTGTDFSRGLSDEQKDRANKLFKQYEEDTSFIDTISIKGLIQIINGYDLVYTSLIHRVDYLMSQFKKRAPELKSGGKNEEETLAKES